MQFLLQTIVFSALISIYWCNHDRRQHLKQKVGRNTYYNLKMVARNIAIMIYPGKKNKLSGDPALLTRGAVLYSFHFGVWELMPHIIRQYLDKNIGVLVNRYTDNNPPLVGKILDKILYYWRSRYCIKIFYPDEVYSIVKFLRNGGIFAALIDGNTIYAKFKKIEKLAHLCNVPLIPFAVYYDKGMAIMQLNCDLEHLLKQRPYDYWWFYRSRISSKTL
ncbi:MAG: hypothetical protein ACPL28_03110 [bacterium]